MQERVVSDVGRQSCEHSPLFTLQGLTPETIITAKLKGDNYHTISKSKFSFATRWSHIWSFAAKQKSKKELASKCLQAWTLLKFLHMTPSPSKMNQLVDFKRPTPSHTPAKFCVSIGNAKCHESFETAKSFARFWWCYQIWTKLLGKYTPSHKDIQGHGPQKVWFVWSKWSICHQFKTGLPRIWQADYVDLSSPNFFVCCLT